MFSNSRNLPIGTALLFVLFVVIMLVAYAAVKPAAPPAELEGVLRPGYKLLQPFALVDHQGDPFTEQRLKGKWSLIFFGYMSCPDICPATLNVLKTVESHLQQLEGELAANPQVVFVSVDPRRDSTEEIAKYISFFNPGFIGATAKKAEIDKITRQFSVGYTIEEEYSPGNYNVAHTSAIFLVDPLGRLVASFSQPHYPEIISTQYAKILQYFGGG